MLAHCDKSRLPCFCGGTDARSFAQGSLVGRRPHLRPFLLAEFAGGSGRRTSLVHAREGRRGHGRHLPRCTSKTYLRPWEDARWHATRGRLRAWELDPTPGDDKLERGLRIVGRRRAVLARMRTSSALSRVDGWMAAAAGTRLGRRSPGGGPS